MKALLVLPIIFSFLILAQSKSSPNCPTSYCSPNGPAIRFPFYLSDGPVSRCGYPGFGLSCDKHSQTILTLPNSGQFIVTSIDYAKQGVYLNDPGRCLPNRIIKNISLLGSPFVPVHLKTYTFFNCSHNITEYAPLNIAVVPCLNENSNYTIVVSDDTFASFWCRNYWRVSIPVSQFVYWYETWIDLTQDIMLTWQEPACRACEVKRGICGFESDNSNKTECFGVTYSGLSRATKYGITIGIGIPGLVCLIGLICHFSNRLWARGQHLEDRDLPNPTITVQRADILMGLDMPTINSYPKTVLGDSGRLPKPNDGTCSICLAEYLPKETLRSIPECNHYFHASCIDEWLKMNATCPLCRNTPSGSSVATPSSSLSLLSSSTSSSP